MIHFLLCLFYAIMVSNATIHGRYTKSLSDYHLLIPHKLAADGEFSTFHLPHFYDHQTELYKDRRKRSLNDPEMIHYGVAINNHLYHVELWPNRDFIHSGLVFEKRDPEANIKDRHVRSLKGKKLCHYTGKVRGYPNSKAAISTCDGLAGYIMVAGNKYFIEPVDDHSPNAEGHHLHVLHDKISNGIRPTCGTRGSWDEAMKKQLKERALNGEDIFKEKRETADIHRYLELAVVCDKTFLAYHKIRDVELYVMTIMNMVADYYHEASIGHPFHVVVVRIIYLEKQEKEIDLSISEMADKTLTSFCKWAVKINTPENTPNHYDIAVLLTRIDICFEGAKTCGLTGLAGFGAGCSKHEPCTINEDSGLTLGIIVAHEIGHLMSADHDGETELCPVQDDDKSNFVMAPYLDSFTTRWSACSRTMINTWLESKLGDCLNDTAGPTLYPFAENMPGVVYDASDQCNFSIPASLGVCTHVKEKICENLLCKLNKTRCTGKGNIAVDGTKCAENKWCFNGKCIETGTRPEAINGGWSDFGPWSECTRSCGGGISFSERECNKPVPSKKGKYCAGDRRQLKICNLVSCPDDAPTFRQQQCSDQDSIPWENKKYTWRASFQEKEPCVLYCVNEKHDLRKIDVTIKDGTRCKHGTRNVCIDGICRKVGCDNVLESEAVEDRCGVCNGDGTQCKMIEETYKDVGQGYTKVVVIPAGARKITIEEVAPSGNKIAISDSIEKKFYLNGNKTEDADGEYRVGPAVGIYTHVEPKKEKFIINGPLKEDVVLFVNFLEPNNPGYVYKWAEPSVDSTYEPRYRWEIGEFEECSVACGGGSQKSTFDCMEEKAGKITVNFCAGLERPKDQVKNCNEQPCQKTWKVGPWGHCRACKKKGGVRLRDVECVEENPKRGADGILVEDDQCEGPKPGSVELCEAEKHCGHKRMISYIPGRYQSQIWSQMNRKYPAKRNYPEKNVSLNDCGSSHNSSLNKSDGILSKTKIGEVLRDIQPLDHQKYEIYSVQENPLRANLSDKADELMGDAVGDIIDTENKTVIKGKMAGIMKHQLEHPINTTQQVNSRKKRCAKGESKKAEEKKVETAGDDDENDDVDSDEDEN